MTAAFGPQNSNAATAMSVDTLRHQRYGNVQTWVRDGSAPGKNDGTILDAAFFNRIIANLEHLVDVSDIQYTYGDITTLHRAIVAVLRGGAPLELSTLQQIADSIGRDPDFSGTVNAALGFRLRFDADQSLTHTQQAQAVANLGFAPVVISGSYADLIGKPVYAPVATSGSYADLANLPTLGTASRYDVGTAGSAVVQLTADAKYPNADGSLIINLTYGNITGVPILGTAAPLNVGTAAFNVLQLNSTAKIPAVNGSLITHITYGNIDGLPVYAAVASSGAYADLSGKPALGTAAPLNVGVAGNNIVQLDGTGRMPAVDGSQMTNLAPGVGGVRYDQAQVLTSPQKAQAQANIGIASEFTAGTAIVFVQAAAPTGWTKSTTHNDKALRVVSGAGAASGGVQPFSTAFARTATDAFTPDTNYMPYHAHVNTDQYITATVRATNNDDSVANNVASGWADRGIGTSAVGASWGHAHGIDLRVQYVDAIICIKN